MQQGDDEHHDDEGGDDDELVGPPAPCRREPKVVAIGAGDDGRPIEKVLIRRLDVSWSHVARLLRQGRVRLGERSLARGETVKRGDEVVIAPPPSRPDGGGPRAPLPNRKLRLRVVHEDPDLLVVVKPAGLATHPGPGHGSDTLLNALVGRYPELVELGPGRGWGLVHRLDLDTSGLLVVARSARAHEALVAAFKERQVRKEYMALVDGRPMAGSVGEVSTPIGGKEALTRWELLETRGGASLVRALPVTGRTHQVRLHLAELGLPVLGDREHGPARRRPGTLHVPRLALHAHRLELAHPVTGVALVLEEPLPRDLRRAWSSATRVARRATRSAEAD